MTEQELEILRQKARALAATVLMEWLAGQLRSLGELLVSDPQLQRELADRWRQKLKEKQDEYSQIAFPECPPELSDMYSAEFQEAFDEMAKKARTALGIQPQ